MNWYGVVSYGAYIDEPATVSQRAALAVSFGLLDEFASAGVGGALSQGLKGLFDFGLGLQT